MCSFSDTTQQTSSISDYANWGEKNPINNIHEIVMISSNVHLFIDLRWKMRLTFKSAQHARVSLHHLMEVKHNASFFHRLFI